MPQFLQSEAFWTAIGPVIAWIAQAYLTPRVAKLEPTNIWKRLIRRAHGVLNQIDPEGKS